LLGCSVEVELKRENEDPVLAERSDLPST